MLAVLWVMAMVNVFALFVSVKAYVLAYRASTAERRRRQVARQAGEAGLPGMAYRVDDHGDVHATALRPGEPIPPGYRYTPASPVTNGHR